MKALTLTEPYASLVARGVKRIETRHWRTNYRGPLAIHAAAGFSPLRQFGYRGTLEGMQEFIRDRPDLHAACRAAGDGPGGRLWAPWLGSTPRSTNGQSVFPAPILLTLGRIVAVAELVDCVPTGGDCVPISGPHERACGDFSPGRYAWVLANVRQLPTPISPRDANGRHPFAQGLWTVPEPIVQRLPFTNYPAKAKEQ